MTADEWSELFDLMCQQFGRDPDPNLATTWLDQLEARLSDDEIRAGVFHIIYAHRFWPSIKQVVEAATGSDTTSRAADQWDIVQQIMGNRRKGPELMEELDDTARKVVSTMGGPPELAKTKLDDVDYRRKEFFDRYADFADAPGREELPPMTDEGRQVVTDAMSGELEP